MCPSYKIKSALTAPYSKLALGEVSLAQAGCGSGTPSLAPTLPGTALVLRDSAGIRVVTLSGGDMDLACAVTVTTDAYGLSGDAVRGFVAVVGSHTVAVSAPEESAASETVLLLLDLETLTPSKEFEGLRLQLTPSATPELGCV